MTATVILGSGIIGVSTAYYLSLTQDASSVYLVEPSAKFFASASGFAGGFLAADWFSPSVTALGKLSYEEHARLAHDFGGREKWGYMKSKGLSYTPGRVTATKARGGDWLRQDASRVDVTMEGVSEYVGGEDEDDHPSWLRRNEGDNIEIISEGGTTAQVDPLRLSEFLLEACLDRGVKLHHPARATSIETDTRGELSSIRILNLDTNSETDIPCTKILIAAGAWSPQVFTGLFPNSNRKIPISSLAGHSLVIRSPQWSRQHDERGCHAIFTTDEDGYSPEIFSRTGGEIYIAGLNSPSLPLPTLPTDSTTDETAVRQLKKTAYRLLGGPHSDDLEIVTEGLCFRPVTKRGTPFLTRIPDEALGNLTTRGSAEGGVWLAAGHGPWGISLSLGSGKIMAEMIQGQPTSVNVTGLGL